MATWDRWLELQVRSLKKLKRDGDHHARLQWACWVVLRGLSEGNVSKTWAKRAYKRLAKAANH